MSRCLSVLHSMAAFRYRHSGQRAVRSRHWAPGLLGIFLVSAVVTASFGRDLVVPVPVQYSSWWPSVVDVAGIPAWGSFYPASIDQVTRSFDATFSNGSDEVVVFPARTNAISSTCFDGSWSDLLWPWYIYKIPFGADTEVCTTIDLTRVQRDSIGLRRRQPW